MLKNIICVDPGVNGGLALVDSIGRVITIPMPDMPKKKNRNGKNIKPTTIEKAHFQISVINGICKFALECCGSDKVPFYRCP